MADFPVPQLTTFIIKYEIVNQLLVRPRVKSYLKIVAQASHLKVLINRRQDRLIESLIMSEALSARKATSMNWER